MMDDVRLIDADSIMEKLRAEIDGITERTNYTIGIADGLGYAIAAIECAQTVDAVPRDYMESEIKYLNYINQKYDQQIKALAKERDAYIARYNDILQKIAERVQTEPLKLELKLPVKRGMWKTTEATIDDGMVTCSYCRKEFYIDNLVEVGNENGYCEFCPSCGADMRGAT